jgi:hypothetical protein
VPTSPDQVWRKEIGTNGGYAITLDGDSFKKFVVQHAVSGIRGGNRKLSSSIFDYNAQGVAGITCKCRHCSRYVSLLIKHHIINI